MKRTLRVSCLLLLVFPLLASCRSSNHGPEGTQERFGVSMARQNLWREAMFRFKRAVEISPTDAQAHNNLAVAYEANGEYDLAAKEYREAMRLDKSNQYIQKNYSRLVEFISRNKKRQQRQQAASAKPAATEAAATPAATPATGTPPATGTAAAPPVTDTAAAPPPQPPPPAATGATPASKPAVVPPMPPAATTPPPTDTAPPPPPPDPAKSGGFA